MGTTRGLVTVIQPRSHDISSCNIAVALNRKKTGPSNPCPLHRKTMSSMPCYNGSVAVPEKGVGVLPPRATAILHRTPWQPPVAVGGQGIYITLEDGREVIDAAGGAAVACIGNGHPVVREAIKEQVDKLACEWPISISEHGFTGSAMPSDVYNMQLSNEPAEELARILINSGKGAFELCGFFAGGACVLPMNSYQGTQLRSIFVQVPRQWRAPSSLPVRSASVRNIGCHLTISIFCSVLA